MKAKYSLMALLALAIAGCDDTTGAMGVDVFPEVDQSILGNLSVYDVTTESVPAGNIYTKTNIGYLGRFTDSEFGTYQANFLTELHAPEGINFPETYVEYDANGQNVLTSGKPAVKAKGKMATTASPDLQLLTDAQGKVVGNLKSANVVLFYDQFFGDSLRASRVSAYELNKSLNTSEAGYVQIKPNEYYDATTGFIGSQTYTAQNKPSTSKNSDPQAVEIEVPAAKAKQLAERIMRKALENGNKLNPKTFNEIFKGLYLTSDYGDGSILYVVQTNLEFISKCYFTDSISGLKLRKKNGEDSVYYARRAFISTREVVQANQLSNDPATLTSRINETEGTYLKTPAGIFTQATLPIGQLEKRLQGDTLNAVRLSFANYQQKDKSKMLIPKDVLLIRKGHKNRFFENNELIDGVSSFLTSHVASTGQYTFGNISRLIRACITEKEAARQKAGSSWNEQAWLAQNPDWDKVILIPVHVSYDKAKNNQGGEKPKIISIRHDLTPGYVRLKGGKKGETDPAFRLKLEVISTQFGKR